MSVDDGAPIYPISVAAKLLSVHPRTLRIYEEEGLIKPSRMKSKRYYSNNDIEWIGCLRGLIHDRGISIPGIKMLLELTPCWQITQCPADKRDSCSAYIDRSIPCWQRASTACSKGMESCQLCEVYIQAMLKAREMVDSRKEEADQHPQAVAECVNKDQ